MLVFLVLYLFSAMLVIWLSEEKSLSIEPIAAFLDSVMIYNFGCIVS